MLGVKDNIWENEFDMVENCDKAPEVVEVWLRPLVKKKIDLLMDKFKNIEWLAYLVGEGNIVDDIYIPKQIVTSTAVDDIKKPSNVKTIGVIHSHHGMGTGFSGTDDEYINQNNDISICVTHKKADGQIRWKTPCGSYKLIKLSIKVLYDIDIDEKKFLEDVDDKITQTRAYAPSASWFGGRYFDRDQIELMSYLELVKFIETNKLNIPVKGKTLYELKRDIKLNSMYVKSNMLKRNAEDVWRMSIPELTEFIEERNLPIRIHGKKLYELRQDVKECIKNNKSFFEVKEDVWSMNITEIKSLIEERKLPITAEGKVLYEIRKEVYDHLHAVLDDVWDLNDVVSDIFSDVLDMDIVGMVDLIKEKELPIEIHGKDIYELRCDLTDYIDVGIKVLGCELEVQDFTVEQQIEWIKEHMEVEIVAE
jgi:hypothetical protein